jgi:hypothetical protein
LLRQLPKNYACQLRLPFVTLFASFVQLQTLQSEFIDYFVGDVLTSHRSPSLDDNDFQRNNSLQHGGESFPPTTSPKRIPSPIPCFRMGSEMSSATRASVADLEDDGSSAASAAASSAPTAADDLPMLPPPGLLAMNHAQQRLLPFGAAALLPTVGFMMEQVGNMVIQYV